MDTVSPAVRSRIVAQVRSKKNKSTELRLIDVLRKEQLSGWRRNSNLPGKPDFIYPKKRVALFIDGCFWHGCPKCCRMPSSNRIYWKAKIARNKKRDKQIAKELRKRGWKVIRVWEHEIGTSQMNKKLNLIKEAT